MINNSIISKLTVVGLEAGAAGGVTLQSILQLVQKFATIGGACWAIWGVIVLAGGLKDHNGPQLQGGIWQIVGGGMILAAAILFGNITA